MPRIERADSVKMLSATISGKKTITLGATFGRISLRKICQSDAPDAIAAWLVRVTLLGPGGFNGDRRRSGLLYPLLRRHRCG